MIALNANQYWTPANIMAFLVIQRQFFKERKKMYKSSFEVLGK
jgi:hypothetical protein